MVLLSGIKSLQNILETIGFILCYVIVYMEKK